jgi:hypothetical protein
MSNTRWIIPEAMEPVSQAPEPGSAPGAAAHGRPLRIGLLDNTKDNARLLLELIGERVRVEMNAQLIERRKGNATVGTSAELLAELAQDADCVITAMAD